RVAEEPEPGADGRDPALLVDDREAERLAPQRRSLSDPLDEAPVLAEAAEGNVLAVVGRRRRILLPLGQGLDRSPAGRPRLVQNDLVPRIDEFEGGGQAGEPAPDDGDPLGHSRFAPTIRSLVNVDSRGGPSKTSKPLASIRSSVARYRPANVPTQAEL